MIEWTITLLTFGHDVIFICTVCFNLDYQGIQPMASVACYKNKNPNAFTFSFCSYLIVDCV